VRVNVYIAKRGRDEHLKNCLHYLNEANRERRYLVTVFITEDRSCPSGAFPCSIYNHLSVWWSICNIGGAFNKSKLLNKCIEDGNQLEYDWFSICDLDMIYPPNWFHLVEQEIKTGVDYLVCHGWKLGEETQESVSQSKAFEELLLLSKVEFPVGPSQVSMTSRCLRLLLNTFGSPLYDESFIGWGGEDSILSSMSRKLYSEGRIIKRELPGVWLHQYHEEKKGGHPDYRKNFEHYQQRNAEIEVWKL
jgi:hypothetical protein